MSRITKVVDANKLHIGDYLLHDKKYIDFIETLEDGSIKVFESQFRKNDFLTFTSDMSILIEREAEANDLFADLGYRAYAGGEVYYREKSVDYFRDKTPDKDSSYIVFKKDIKKVLKGCYLVWNASVLDADIPFKMELYRDTDFGCDEPEEKLLTEKDGFSPKEIQAINKKMEELGWFDENN